MERAVFSHLRAVRPEATPGTVEHDVRLAVHAPKEMVTAERGKTARLSRTRKKIGRDGEARAAADLTLRQTALGGFVMPVERGHPELPFEAVVPRQSKTFDAGVHIAARDRPVAGTIDPTPSTQAGTGDQPWPI
ncbi:hypothetical protein [Palleronia rufa]|uniref:hypothetical protein n=1 Tax=Palleronia rufa TaxID=1530186 RepID=UPI001267F4A6|nr:hypothetical protein [Palleronia rufa]